MNKRILSIITILILNISGCISSSNDEISYSWAYQSLSSDYSTNKSYSSNVGIGFTPQANKKYEVQIYYVVKSPVLETVAPRPGLNWSSGLVEGTAYIESPALQTTVESNCNINTVCIAPIGGLDTNSSSYGGTITALLRTGTTPSGTIEVTLASETEGTTVMMMKGSYLKYRTYS